MYDLASPSEWPSTSDGSSAEKSDREKRLPDRGCESGQKTHVCKFWGTILRISVCMPMSGNRAKLCIVFSNLLVMISSSVITGAPVRACCVFFFLHSCKAWSLTCVFRGSFNKRFCILQREKSSENEFPICEIYISQIWGRSLFSGRVSFWTGYLPKEHLRF